MILGVHPNLTHTFTVDANVLFRNWEASTFGLTGKDMESLQGLGVDMQGIREWNVSNGL
jgi:hypothetical protein